MSRYFHGYKVSCVIGRLFLIFTNETHLGNSYAAQEREIYLNLRNGHLLSFSVIFLRQHCSGFWQPILFSCFYTVYRWNSTLYITRVLFPVQHYATEFILVVECGFKHLYSIPMTIKYFVMENMLPCLHKIYIVSNFQFITILDILLLCT